MWCICGCKFIFEICQLILNDEKAKMNDFGQPFACIGGGKIGFGYGDQDVVLVNQDAFGNQCANSTRVYDLTGKNKNINEIGTILNGEINVDEQATIRIVDMLIQQPQKKEEDENDSWYTQERNKKMNNLMHHRYKGYIFVYTRSYTYYVGGMIHEKMYKVVFLKKLFRTSRTICNYLYLVYYVVYWDIGQFHHHTTVLLLYYYYYDIILYANSSNLITNIHSFAM